MYKTKIINAFFTRPTGRWWRSGEVRVSNKALRESRKLECRHRYCHWNRGFSSNIVITLTVQSNRKNVSRRRMERGFGSLDYVLRTTMYLKCIFTGFARILREFVLSYFRCDRRTLVELGSRIYCERVSDKPERRIALNIKKLHTNIQSTDENETNDDSGSRRTQTRKGINDINTIEIMTFYLSTGQ